MRNQSAITMIQSPGNEKTIGMVTRRFSSSSPHAEIGVGTNHTIGECRAAGPGRSRAPMTMRLSASHLIMFPMIETQGLIVELSTGCHRGRHSPVHSLLFSPTMGYAAPPDEAWKRAGNDNVSLPIQESA